MDGATFNGSPSKDYTVREDPRDATAEYGRKLVEATVRKLVDFVRENADRALRGKSW